MSIHNWQPIFPAFSMIYLDEPSVLLGINMPQCTYFYSGFMVTAVEPLMITRVMELGENMFVFLDDALPLDVCFMTTQAVVNKINHERITFGLSPTYSYLEEVEALTPLVPLISTPLQ